MSVHKRTGGVYQVKWRDETGRQRSRTFTRAGDAKAFDEEVKRRKRLGPVLAGQLIDKPQTITLAQFAQTGFRTHAAKLAQKTREQYRWALDLHLSELLDEPLYALDVPRLDQHQTLLLENGRSVNTVRTALTMLSGIMQVAVDHGLIPANPVRSLRKVAEEPKADVVPLSPVELEVLIASFTGRSRIILVLGGHLGLSPVEIRHADWDLLDERLAKLTIPAAKTKRQRARTRVIDVPAVTMRELRAWRIESGRRSGPIVGELTAGAFRQWQFRTLHPLGVTVYQLRHSHASALHYCGWTVPAAARRLGHAPTVHLKHYAHVIDALEGQPRFADLDALIGWARADGAVKAAAR